MERFVTHPSVYSDHPALLALISETPRITRESSSRQPAGSALADLFAAAAMRGTPWKSWKLASPIAELRHEASTWDKRTTNSWPVVTEFIRRSSRTKGGCVGSAVAAAVGSGTAVGSVVGLAVG